MSNILKRAIKIILIAIAGIAIVWLFRTLIGTLFVFEPVPPVQTAVISDPTPVESLDYNPDPMVNVTPETFISELLSCANDSIFNMAPGKYDVGLLQINKSITLVGTKDRGGLPLVTIEGNLLINAPQVSFKEIAVVSKSWDTAISLDSSKNKSFSANGCRFESLGSVFAVTNRNSLPTTISFEQCDFLSFGRYGILIQYLGGNLIVKDCLFTPTETAAVRSAICIDLKPDTISHAAGIITIQNNNFQLFTEADRCISITQSGFVGIDKNSYGVQIASVDITDNYFAESKNGMTFGTQGVPSSSNFVYTVSNSKTPALFNDAGKTTEPVHLTLHPGTRYTETILAKKVLAMQVAQLKQNSADFEKMKQAALAEAAAEKRQRILKEQLEQMGSNTGNLPSGGTTIDLDLGLRRFTTETNDFHPETDSPNRMKLMSVAFSAEGNIPYFWGGKYPKLGRNPEWGQVKPIVSESPYPEFSVGAIYPYGLDCSGYVEWVYLNALGIDIPAGRVNIAKIGEKKPINALKPGDLAYNATHIGMFVCYDKDGKPMFIHESAGSVMNVSFGYCEFEEYISVNGVDDT